MPLALDNVLEKLNLEELWEVEHECQSTHRNSSTGESTGDCSVEVTHRWWATHPGGATVNICQVQADYVHSFMATTNKCRGCHRLASECWRIVAI